MAIASPLKLTAMYHAQVAIGATLMEKDGWHVPATYTSVEAEVEMVGKAGGIYDLSPLGKLDIQGTDALGRLSQSLSLSSSLQVGQALHAPNPTSQGSNVDDIIVAGLSYDEALVLTPPAQVASVAQFLEERLEECAHLVDLTSSQAGVGVVGPLSYKVLAKLADLDLDPSVFDDGRCVQCKAAEIQVLILRSDIGGVLGYEMYVTRDFGEYIWDALLHAGHGEGVGPFGVEALEQLKSGV